MELKLNHSSMGMRPRGEAWKWYTATVGRIARIHVHNDTKGGKWTWYCETAILKLGTKNLHDTPELAYLEARDYVRGILERALEDLSIA